MDCPAEDRDRFHSHALPARCRYGGKILSWDMKTLKYEYIEKQEEVRKHIQNCEGKHTQQAIYSTFHNALTQICFNCKKIRTSLLIWNLRK